jgi:S-DNA-T family DNA segregation ATPase FtsK/SpoIIIE
VARHDADDPDLILDTAEQVIQYQNGSVSFVQRRLYVGYATATRLLAALERLRVVGPQQGGTIARDVLVTDFDRTALATALGAVRPWTPDEIPLTELVESAGPVSAECRASRCADCWNDSCRCPYCGHPGEMADRRQG